MYHYGNPVDGNTRVIRLLGLELGTLQSGMNYQGNGQFTGTIHSVNEGVDTLGFEVIGAGLGEKHAELTYTAGAYDLTQSTITAAPSLITADGEAKSVATVQLRDAQGQIVANDSETVILSGLTLGQIGDGSVTTPDFTMRPVGNGSGQYTIEINSTKVGNDT